MNFDVVKEVVAYARSKEKEYNKISGLPLPPMVCCWMREKSRLHQPGDVQLCPLFGWSSGGQR